MRQKLDVDSKSDLPFALALATTAVPGPALEAARYRRPADSRFWEGHTAPEMAEMGNAGSQFGVFILPIGFCEGGHSGPSPAALLCRARPWIWFAG